MRSLWESFKLKRKKKMKNEQTSPFKYALDNKILLDHDYLVFSWSKKKSTCWLCVRTSICIQISHDMLMTFYDNDENIQPESDRKIDKVLWHYCSVSHMFLVMTWLFWANSRRTCWCLGGEWRWRSSASQSMFLSKSSRVE